MDEINPNFTEELRNGIKQENQEMDEAIYSPKCLEKQNTEKENLECSDVVYINQVHSCVMRSERENSSYRKVINCSNEFSKKKNEKLSFKTEDIFHKTVKICEKEFHTGKKLYKCVMCHKKYVNFPNLNYHLNRHIGEKPFQCQICQRGFSSSNYLKRHQAVHTEEKTFQCQICLKRFSCSKYLKQHQVIHIGQKTFQYQKCEKEFRTGKKLYKCLMCHKNYVSFPNLNYHLNRHIGEKPFQCQICQRGFSSSNYLKRHQAVHTEEKYI